MQIELFADVMRVRKLPTAVPMSAARRDQRQHKPRGRITSFTRKSRKRMIEQLAKLRSVDDGYFVTLTYPDDVEHSGEKAKRDLAALRKRLARRFPTVGGIWRIELKPRLSGARKGEIAPHFHILVFGWQQREQLARMWIALAWSRIVYETDTPPRRVRTRVDVINSRKHAARYASKYAAKAEQAVEQCNNIQTFEFGRRWASFGALDFSCQVVITSTARQVVELRRQAVRWLHARGSRFEARLARGSPHHGFAVLGLGDLSLPGGLFESTVLRMICAM